MDRVLPERPLFRARVEAAGQRLAALAAEGQAPPLRAVHELIVAGLAIRRLQTQSARAALTRVAAAATLARIPALIADANGAVQMLEAPAARLLDRGESRPLRLDEVERLLAYDARVSDDCRHCVRHSATHNTEESRTGEKGTQ